MTALSQQIDARPSLAAPYAERYDMLDGWRGVAALAVVLCHVAHVDTGFYAVLLFFVISGYCITAASEACRRKGLGFGQFMWRRVRRIYPPYLLSMAFFAATRVVRSMHGDGAFHRSAIEWIQNLTLTQWFTLVGHPMPYASDNPTLFVDTSWSLCYEEQFYLIVALAMLLSYFASRRLTVALMLVGLAWNIHSPRAVDGFFLDYWPHFAIGAIVFYRLCRMTRPMWRRITDTLFSASLIAFAVLAWRQPDMTPAARPFYSELFVTVAFALTLIGIRPLSGSFKNSPLGRVMTFLGLISYSLYLIHQFNMHLIHAIATAIVWHNAPHAVLIAVEVCGHVVLATLFWRFCERPFLNPPIVPGDRSNMYEDKPV
jgi:peptidoglycan/LPS O-acetylase OafA/YrhL